MRRETGRITSFSGSVAEDADEVVGGVDVVMGVGAQISITGARAKSFVDARFASDEEPRYQRLVRIIGVKPDGGGLAQIICSPMFLLIPISLITVATFQAMSLLPGKPSVPFQCMPSFSCG